MSDWRVGVAWALFAVTVVLAAVQVGVLATSSTPLISGQFSDDGFPVVTIAGVVASGVGALIVTRHPRHRIGWLFLLGQVGTTFGLACQAYGFVALTDGGSRTAGQVALWLSVLTGGIFALTLMALLLLLVPDGRLLSPRWRWAVWVTITGLVLYDGAALTISPSRLDANAQLEGDAPLVLVVVTALGSACLAVGLGAGAASLVVRMRRAAGEERAQLQWIGSAAFALAVTVPLSFVLALVYPVWVANLPMMLAYLAVPLVTGVAILRFRLYDIDLLLNRSIVLGVLTTFVASVYVAVVVVLGQGLDLGHDDYDWTSVIATVVAAVGFQPLRRRVDRLADRLVYGAQAAPYEALSSFSEQLRGGLGAADLLSTTAEAVGRLLGARRVTVWVDRPGDAPAVASWEGPGADSDGGTALAVVDEREELGGFTVWMARGRGLRPSERDLLEGFAGQLGPAFRTLRLEAELERQVALLAEHGEAMEASRNRLVSAQAEERRRFEATMGREVLPHLSATPTTLHRLADEASASGCWPRAEVDRLITDAGSALDSLRALTRGVFPAQLARRGLGPALTAHVSTSGHRLVMADGLHERRFAPEVESVAYFCAVESLRALEGPCTISLEVIGGRLTVRTEGAPGPTFATDTEHLLDRAEALGGSMVVDAGASLAAVTVRLPVASLPRQPDRAQVVGVEG